MNPRFEIEEKWLLAELPFFTEKCTIREKIATFGHQVAVVENFFNIIYSVHVESSAETQVQNNLIVSKCFHGG